MFVHVACLHKSFLNVATSQFGPNHGTEQLIRALQSQTAIVAERLSGSFVWRCVVFISTKLCFLILRRYSCLPVVRPGLFPPPAAVYQPCCSGCPEACVGRACSNIPVQQVNVSLWQPSSSSECDYAAIIQPGVRIIVLRCGWLSMRASLRESRWNGAQR